MQAGTAQTQPSGGSDKPLFGSASDAIVVHYQHRRIQSKPSFNEGKGAKWRSAICPPLAATASLTTHSQALLKAASKTRKG